MHFTPIEFWKLFVPHRILEARLILEGIKMEMEGTKKRRDGAGPGRQTWDIHTMLNFSPTLPTPCYDSQHERTHTHKHVHVFFMCFFFFGISEYFMPELSQKETRRSKPRGLEPCVHSHGSLWMSNCWSERSEIVSQHLERAGTEWLFL